MKPTTTLSITTSVVFVFTSCYQRTCHGFIRHPYRLHFLLTSSRYYFRGASSSSLSVSRMPRVDDESIDARYFSFGNKNDDDDEFISDTTFDARMQAEETFQLLARRGKTWRRLGHLVMLALQQEEQSDASSLTPSIETNNVSRTSQNRIADIGTDHGLLAISLALTGQFEKVIGVDASEQALKDGALTLLQDMTEQQQENRDETTTSSIDNRIEKFLLRDRLEFRVGDGLRGLRDDVVHIVCIAGMGSKTMIKILTAESGKFDDGSKNDNGHNRASRPQRLLDKIDCQKLILQPTNCRPKQMIELYDELQHAGFTLEDERIEYLSSRWYITVLFSRSITPVDDKEVEERELLLPGSKLSSLSDQSAGEMLSIFGDYVRHHRRWIQQDAAFTSTDDIDDADKRWLEEFESFTTKDFNSE